MDIHEIHSEQVHLRELFGSAKESLKEDNSVPSLVRAAGFIGSAREVIIHLSKVQHQSELIDVRRDLIKFERQIETMSKSMIGVY